MKKTRIVFSFIAVFAAGAVAGGAVVFAGLRHLPFRLPEPDKISAKIVRELRSNLHLSDDQVAKIQPLVVRNVQEIETIHSEAFQKIGEKLRSADDQILPFLNPEQVQAYEKFKKDRPAPPPQ